MYIWIILLTILMVEKKRSTNFPVKALLLSATYLAIIGSSKEEEAEEQIRLKSPNMVKNQLFKYYVCLLCIL